MVVSPSDSTCGEKAMDEKGYVLSEVGMLLLIPLMIMIPIALSLQEEGSQIPTTFTKSDVVFRTFESIRNDIEQKAIRFSDNIYNKTYKYNESQLFAEDLKNLNNNISGDIYEDAYAGVVDSVKVEANNYPKTRDLTNESGYIPLINGIQIIYNYENTTITNNTIYYKYRITITVNVTIDVIKANARHKETCEYSFGSLIFINTATNNNTTAEENIRTFFNNLGSKLG